MPEYHMTLEELKEAAFKRKVEREVDRKVTLANEAGKRERARDRSKRSKNNKIARARTGSGEKTLSKERTKLRQMEEKHITAEIQELASRELAKRDLTMFAKKFMPTYDPGWVHIDIAKRLVQFMEDVQAEKSPRLMLFMPPRHGKSQLASIFFPAFLLGHNPTFEIIASSYAVSLPIGFSRKVKTLIQTKVFTEMFEKTRLSKESQAAEAWLTSRGGGYVAAGVGGGITGKGAHVFIVDDPVKDAQEADSETIREANWDWWGSTAKTRLAPGGGVLVIQTRWHDDDLSGRLIRQMTEQRGELNELIEETADMIALTENIEDAEALQSQIDGYEDELTTIDDWEVVSYPAIAVDNEYIQFGTRKVVRPEDMDMDDAARIAKAMDEDPTQSVSGFRLLRKKGEPLHESRFPLPRLKNMKRSMQPRHWSALYQQNPVPDEGEFFQKDMFRYTPQPVSTKGMHIYSAWDLAIGQKQTNDFTVGVVAAIDFNDNVHILDVIRFKGDAFRIVEALLDVEKKYSPLMLGIEKGQLEMAIRPQLLRRMQERKLFPTLAEGRDALVPITDKIVRARPLQGRMQQGMVHFPSNQPWVEPLQQEMLRFPGGVHDDQVDAMAWLLRMTLKRAAPQRPKSKVGKSWKDRLKGMSNRDRDPMSA